MRVGTGRSAEAERRDALRRRLYAPDVTEAEVAAYRATRRTPVDRARIAVVAGAVLLVAAVVIVVLVSTRPPAAVAPPRASLSSAVPPALTQSTIPASASMRLAFVGALQEGRSAGLLPFFLAHPTARPANLRTNGRADSTEYSGHGSSTIALDPSALAEHGGRVTVIVVTDRAAAFTWTAERIAQRNDRSGPVVTLATQRGSTRPGEPVASTFVYDGGAPARLALELGARVHWGAVVVFTD